jgi:hypothetical protein
VGRVGVLRFGERHQVEEDALGGGRVLPEVVDHELVAQVGGGLLLLRGD